MTIRWHIGPSRLEGALKDITHICVGGICGVTGESYYNQSKHIGIPYRKFSAKNRRLLYTFRLFLPLQNKLLDISLLIN